MNTLDFLKNGSGIHIKEKNKGKFTSYCGGKVTDECIRKAKASGNPTLVKRATFALNARRWKHKDGGIITALEGTKFLSKQWLQNTGLNINKFLSSDFGKFAIKGVNELFNGLNLAEMKDNLQKWKQAYVNSVNPQDYSLQVAEEEKQIKLENPDYNISPIVSKYKENILATQAANKAKQEASQEADWIIMLLLLNLNNSSTGGGFGSLLTKGLAKGSEFFPDLLNSFKSSNKQLTSMNFENLNSTPKIAPTTDLGNGFSYNLNTGMTYKPNWNSMLKYLFGGKYFLPPIKTSYGYPVYWSDDALPPDHKWAKEYLKENSWVTGMAAGEGAQGPDDIGPKAIIRNVHSDIITDRNDKRWDGLDKIEAVRHYMNEINYEPNFEISPEQDRFRKENMPKNAGYNKNDRAYKESIISRIISGDMEGTPEQTQEAERLMKEFRKQKGYGYW